MTVGSVSCCPSTFCALCLICSALITKVVALLLAQNAKDADAVASSPSQRRGEEASLPFGVPTRGRQQTVEAGPQVASGKPESPKASEATGVAGVPVGAAPRRLVPLALQNVARRRVDARPAGGARPRRPRVREDGPEPGATAYQPATGRAVTLTTPSVCAGATILRGRAPWQAQKGTFTGEGPVTILRPRAMACGPKGQVPHPDRLGEVGVAAVPATPGHPLLGRATLRPQMCPTLPSVLPISWRMTPQVPPRTGRAAAVQVVPTNDVRQDGPVVDLEQDAVAASAFPRPGAQTNGRQGAVGRLEVEAQVPPVGRQAHDPPGEASVRVG